jgi:hypothetical protein
MDLPSDCIDVVKAEIASVDHSGLCFSEGEIICVTSKEEESQWEGRIGSRKGSFEFTDFQGTFPSENVTSILTEVHS